MNLVFFNNSLNHHQVHVADELYKLLGEEYSYVTTVSKDRCGKKGGVDYSDRPYCIMAGDSVDSYNKAIDLARNADVCVFGAETIPFAIERAQCNPQGLSFELSERWLKKGWINMLSPRLRRWWLAYMRYFRKANFYKLNASAFAANDHYKLQTYKGKCFKWGYFTSVDCDGIYVHNLNNPIRLMWCSRFIDWKHPELAIECVKMLKDHGFSYQLDMYGDGIIKERIEKRVKELCIEENVRFYGNVANEEVHKAMRDSDIFLFTSDKEEGWGAVANEAMTEGCCVVASNEIGAAPYLIKNGSNGLLFKSNDVDSLTEKVEWLFTHPSEMQQMKINARRTMTEIWSPRNAAINLLQLIDDLQNGRPCSVKEGPASIAELI